MTYQVFTISFAFNLIQQFNKSLDSLNDETINLLYQNKLKMMLLSSGKICTDCEDSFREGKIFLISESMTKWLKML